MKFVILPSTPAAENVSALCQSISPLGDVCMYLLKVNISVLQQLFNRTSLRCVCTGTSVLREREQNQLLVSCVRADNTALHLNALFLRRVVNGSTGDPYFKPTLSSE